MTRNQIESAIKSGNSFTIYMADGRQYDVPSQDYIFMGPKSAHVVIVDDDDHHWILPLLTMTGIRYRTTETAEV